MFVRFLKILGILMLIGGLSRAGADVLLIEEVRERMLRDLPANGLTQAEVSARYGVPNQRHAPVGDPPITRWVYDDYSVYFEYDLVIDSVLNPGAVVSRTGLPD
ncbi:MAG: hypothetical protein ACPGJE_03615 [Wenzhouxiangellaceae bacterium]